MTTFERSSPPDLIPDDLVARAADLVNPASGLANDYLNVFNEIVMMIDLLPDMPDLADNIEAWSPVSYRAYFARSTLAGKEGALDAYEGLEPSFRKTFDKCAANLSRAARSARSNILNQRSREDETSTLAQLCAGEAKRLRTRLDRIAEMVNCGPAQAA